MIFSHDTEVALNGAAALVNTTPGITGHVLNDPAVNDPAISDPAISGRVINGSGQELLPDTASLDRFVRDWGWTGPRAGDQAELDAVRALRPRLAQLWQLDEDDAVVLVNAMLAETRALPQLQKHDSWDYHLHATPPDAPLDVRMLVEAAMAFVDVIRMKQLDRLRRCAAADCGDVLVDLSKNRSRRFCDPTCGNRVNVAAYRARRAGQP